MAGPAYQKLGNRFSAESNYGTVPFGTAPFGGDEYIPFELPVLAPGSDRLDDSQHVVVAEIVHKRHGLIVGARVHSNRRRWKQVFEAITRDEVDALLAFFTDRVFGVLPAGDSDGETIVVRWIQNEFRAVTLRGGFYNLTYDIEELPNYQVA